MVVDVVRQGGGVRVTTAKLEADYPWSIWHLSDETEINFAHKRWKLEEEYRREGWGEVGKSYEPFDNFFKHYGVANPEFALESFENCINEAREAELPRELVAGIGELLMEWRIILERNKVGKEFSEDQVEQIRSLIEAYKVEA